MAQDNVKVKIEGIDKLTPVIQKLNDVLNKLNQTLSKFSNIATKSFDKAGKSIEKSTKKQKKLKQEAIKTINEIAEIYRKAEKIGGFGNLTKAELGRIGGLKTKLNKLKSELSQSDKYSIEIKEFNKLVTLKEKIYDEQLQKERELSKAKWDASIKSAKAVNYVKNIQERYYNDLLKNEKFRMTLMRNSSDLVWDTSIKSAKAIQYKNLIYENFFKNERKRSQFFQSFYKASFNYEKQFNTNRVRIIENSNKQILKNAKAFVDDLNIIYRKASILGGFQHLPVEELKKIGRLKRQIDDLKAVAPKDVQVEIDRLLSKAELKELSVYKKMEKEEERLQEKKQKGILANQKLQEKFLKEHIRRVKASNKLEESQYKKRLFLLEKMINAELQLARQEGKFTVSRLTRVTALQKEHSALLREGEKKGFVLPEEVVYRTRKFRQEVAHLNNTIGISNSLLHEWWRRFGAVALGFTVVYRAMLYVELAIGSLVSQVIDGIRAFDTFQESLVRLSMFYQIFGKVGNDTAKSLKYSASVIEALKNASVDALSPIQDITQGIDELAQHGVFLTASTTKAFVDMTDFIGMIAKTTGSQANQIRQELQALFEGTQRAGNTLIRFIANAFGNKVVKDIQKAISPTEQFYIIMKKISDYMREHKEILFGRSFSLSVQRAKNIFTLLVDETLTFISIMRTGDKYINPFADALNKGLNKLGLIAFKRVRDLRVELSKALKDYEKGKITLKTLTEKQEEYNKALEEYSKSPAFEISRQLMTILDTLAYDILPVIVDAIPKLVNFVSNAVRTMKAFYDVNKQGIDIIVTIIKWLVIFRVSMFTFRLAFLEPLLLVKSMSGKLGDLALKFFVVTNAVGGFIPKLKDIKKIITGTALLTSLKTILIVLGTITKRVLLLTSVVIGIISVLSSFEKVKNVVVKAIIDIIVAISDLSDTAKMFIEKIISIDKLKQFSESLGSYSENMKSILQDIKGNVLDFITFITGMNFDIILKPPKPMFIDVEKEEDALTKVKNKAEMYINELEKYAKNMSEVVKVEFVKAYNILFGTKPSYYLKQLDYMLEEYKKKIANAILEIQDLGNRDFDPIKAKELENKLAGLIIKYKEYEKEVKKTKLLLKEEGITYKEFWDWYTTGFEYAVERNRMILENFKNTTDALFNQVSDGIYGFLTGRLKTFKDWIYNLRDIVVKAIADMVAQLIKFKIISWSIGLGGGSAFISESATSFGSVVLNANGNVLKGGIKFFANGGIVDKPTLGLVGEGKYNEAIVPLPDGRHIPAIVKTLPQQPIQIQTVVQVQAIDGQSVVDFERRTGAISSIAEQSIVRSLQNNGIVRQAIKRYW